MGSLLFTPSLALAFATTTTTPGTIAGGVHQGASTGKKNRKFLPPLRARRSEVFQSRSTRKDQSSSIILQSRAGGEGSDDSMERTLDSKTVAEFFKGAPFIPRIEFNDPNFIPPAPPQGMEFQNPGMPQAQQQMSPQGQQQAFPSAPPFAPPSTPPTIPKFGIVVVDNFCPYHSGYVSHRAREVHGIAVINVLSNYMTGYLYQQHNATSHVEARLPLTPNETKEWLANLKEKVCFGQDMTLVGVYCESDAGLDEAEMFAQLLAESGSQSLLRHNGYNLARRNKYEMNAALSEAGLSTVKQKLCSTVEEAIEFCKTDLQMEDVEKSCVVKPYRGAGTDMVQRCQTLKEVKKAFESIYGQRIFGTIETGMDGGGTYEQVLVQEFAIGQEYAVDIVSKGGQHKVAAVWKYDKRPANGAAFVYYATVLARPETDLKARVACQYAKAALDALGVRWGLSHNEVMVEDDAQEESNPASLHCKLIEVNCRQHNIDLVPLTSMAVGYNVFDMLLASYLGDFPGHTSRLTPLNDPMVLEWDNLPDVPASPRAHAAVIHLVCEVEGQIVGINHLESIQNLPSVAAIDIYENFGLGSSVTPTIDIRTDAGWVHLVHEDEKQFNTDYQRIIQLMPSMFTVKPLEPFQ